MGQQAMQRTYPLVAKQTSSSRNYPSSLLPSLPQLIGMAHHSLFTSFFSCIIQSSHGVRRHKPDRLKGKCIEAHMAQLCGKGRGDCFI